MTPTKCPFCGAEAGYARGTEVEFECFTIRTQYPDGDVFLKQSQRCMKAELFKLKAEAVERGYAEWIVSTDGTTKWQ